MVESPSDRGPPPPDRGPAGRFSDRAADYARYRPSYPDEAVRAIEGGMRPPLTIADVGAGTGICSRLLADRGHRVLAIEPNAAMRRVALAHPRITRLEATAEATALPDSSVDIVVCAQAFHWFRPREAAAEFARILRPGGRLILMWNVRDDRDPFTACYSRLMADASGGSSIDRGEFDRLAIEALGLFEPLALAEFPSDQRLDHDGLLGRALSASYFPRAESRRSELLRALSGQFHAHARAGLVRLAYRTRVWATTKR